MTPRVRRIWGGTLLVIVAFSSAIAAYIAYQQHQTARTKLRHDLYERRAGILRGVLVALSPVFRDGRVAGEVIPLLVRATSEKEVLLNAELCKYLDDLYRK